MLNVYYLYDPDHTLHSLIEVEVDGNFHWHPICIKSFGQTTPPSDLTRPSTVSVCAMSRLSIFIITALLLFFIVTINGGPLKKDDKRKFESFPKVSLVKREAEPVGGHRRKPFGGVRRRPNLGRDRVRQAQRNRDGSSKRGKREVDSVESSLGMLLPAPLVKREADPVGGHRRKPFGGVRRRPNLGRDRVRQAQRRNRAKRSPEGRGEGGRGRYPKRGIRSNNKSNIFARKNY